VNKSDLNGVGSHGRGSRAGKLNWLTRIRVQKMLANERGDEISDEEAKRRAVAKLHRPKLKRLTMRTATLAAPTTRAFTKAPRSR